MRCRVLIVTAMAATLALLGVQNASATQDTLWQKQYGPEQIGAPTAWQRSTAKGVKAAVIDSGVDVHHPDLQRNLDLADSHDFGCDDNDPNDDSTIKAASGLPAKGHGTHVSGIIAAEVNNGQGIAGVAPDVKLMVEKIFPTDDSCRSVDTALNQTSTAIDYAVAHGAKAINLSASVELTGGVTKSDAAAIRDTTTACNNAFAKGALCVISSGNAGETRASGYDYDINAIIVTANDASGQHAYFGQKADTKWSVSAPGVDVLSTWPTSDTDSDGYKQEDGTSMAAPHVTAAAALLFGTGMTNKQVAETLVGTAGPAHSSAIEGAGLIHVDRALGFEPAPTTLPSQRGTGSGVGTATKTGRAGAAGGSGAVAPTTTSSVVPGSKRRLSSFEEGLSADDSSRDFNALRLKEASKNSANQPFNVAGPLVAVSILATIAMAAVAIPRLRSKDVPLT